MDILHFIFFLACAFIIFRMLWGVLMLLIQFLKGDKKNKTLFDVYFFKAINYYFLVSLTAMAPNHFISLMKGTLSPAIFFSTGGVILFLYLFGKVKRTEMKAAISRYFKNTTQPTNHAIEGALLGAGMVLYILCIYFPALYENSLNLWLFGSVTNIYNTPIIGWIIKIVGVFFMFAIMSRGLNVIQNFFRKIAGQPEKRGPFQSNFNFKMGGFDSKEEEEEEEEEEPTFSDYEIIDDTSSSQDTEAEEEQETEADEDDEK